MKILIIPYNYPTRENPNRAVFVKDHRDMLESTGNRVDVLGVIPKTLSDIVRSKNLKFGRLSNERWLISVLAIKGRHRFNQWLAQIIGKYLLEKYLEKQKGDWPDIIHVHNATSAELALWCFKKYGIPYVITEHSSALWDYDAEVDPRRVKKFYEKSKANIAVSEKFATHLSNKFSCHFHYLPNPVDTEFFQCNQQKDSKVIKLISVGNLTKNKNHQLAIRSIEKCAKTFQSIEYMIVGEGSELKPLIELVNQLKLNKFIKFVGKKNREDIRELLCSSDFFLLPSIAETFGVVLIEAMACGLPVMALRNGGSESIIVTTDVGFLVESQEEFAEKLSEFCTREYDRKKISIYASKNFSFSAISKLQLDLYQ